MKRLWIGLGAGVVCLGMVFPAFYGDSIRHCVWWGGALMVSSFMVVVACTMASLFSLVSYFEDEVL